MSYNTKKTSDDIIRSVKSHLAAWPKQELHVSVLWAIIMTVVSVSDITNFLTPYSMRVAGILAVITVWMALIWTTFTKNPTSKWFYIRIAIISLTSVAVTAVHTYIINAECDNTNIHVGVMANSISIAIMMGMFVLLEIISTKMSKKK